MMVKINSDESNVTSINHNSVEKVSPVRGISPTGHHPEHGNNLPDNKENPDQKFDVKQAGNTENLDKAVKEMNQNMQMVHREIHFSVDEDSGKTVIKVMDLATKEVIRQIPNEEALSFARTIGEGSELNLIDEYI